MQVAADLGFIERLRAALRAHADAARAGPMQAYMKSTMPFLGLPAPVRRQVALQVVKAQPLVDARTLAATMAALWDGATYREERYVASELARMPPHPKLLSPDLLPVYESMIVSGAWWDHCDEISGQGLATLLRLWPGTLKPVLRRWAAGPDLWLRRASFLCQRGLKQGFDAELFYATLLPSIGDGPQALPHAREFFIRKGIGWALRERSYQAPEEVLAFCEAHREQLSALSLREALKALQRRRA